MACQTENTKCRHRKQFLWLILILIFFFGLRASSVLPLEPLDGVRSLADGKRFDYVVWTLKALFNKAVSASLGVEKFLNDEQQATIVKAYFDQVGVVEEKERALEDVLYHSSFDESQFQLANEDLNEARTWLKKLAPLAEAIIQNQTEHILLDMGFGYGGQIIPPVLYEVTDLPLNLIVSARDEIGTVISISLKPGIDEIEKNEIENDALNRYDYSALIEEVGGVGTYPTMVLRINSINWLFETVAHEWIHNYLTLRPLGVRYFTNNAMRTINETTASLAGKEIGRAVIKTFYPEHIVIGTCPKRELYWVISEEEQNSKGFNYRAEMRETRVTVDELLAQGQILMAERYMEQRRLVFWDEGFRIRKLNQAYFAFYGSYNDTPGGGASGKDPVGPAVRALRYSLPHLKAFIDTIQDVRSLDDLMKIAP